MQLEVLFLSCQKHRDDNVHTFSNTLSVWNITIWKCSETEMSTARRIRLTPCPVVEASRPTLFSFPRLDFRPYLCSPKTFKITKPVNEMGETPLFSWSEVSGWYRTQAQSRSDFIVLLSALQQSGNLNLGPRLWKRSLLDRIIVLISWKADQPLIRAEQTRNSGGKICSAEMLTLFPFTSPKNDNVLTEVNI